MSGRQLILIASLSLAFCVYGATSHAQWDSLPRQEPDGGAAAQAGWGQSRYSQYPQAPPATAAKSTWTSWMWPFPSWGGSQSATATKAAPAASQPQSVATAPKPAQPQPHPRLPSQTAATIAPASPAPRPWFESDLWSVGNMPGQSVMRGAPQPSPAAATIPQQSAQTAAAYQGAPGPRVAALPSVGYVYPGTADTTIAPAPQGAAQYPSSLPATGYYGSGTPLTHSQYAAVPPESPATRSMVAEGLANVDPDELDAADYEYSWQVLPKSLIYHTYLAGVKEPRLAAVFNSENNRGDILDLTAGARVGLLRYGTRDVFEPDGWQMDVEGAAFTRLDPEENMDMEATDYKFGVPLTYGCGRYQMKIAYSHLSSHLGDEYAIRNGLAERVNYSRDALVWGHSLYATENLRFYFEIGYAMFCDVNEPWDTQFGIEYSPICNGRFGAPFAAFNTHLRQEVNFGGNFVMQVGWQWTSPETAHRVRLGLQYYNGNEEQFEFYSQSEQKVGLGLWYDF